VTPHGGSRADGALYWKAYTLNKLGRRDEEDLKLMAINGLMQSDSERAIPLFENMLKGAQSPKMKERALFVLAESSVPKAQQLLEQVARGGGNPDLQVKAITYVGVARRKQGAGNGSFSPRSTHPPTTPT